MSLKLNLGSADRHFDGYVSVDKVLPASWQSPIDCQYADLSHPRWPWENSSVDEIRAWDVIEHLPNRILTMNEAWRILVPGGRLDIEVPNAARGAGFFQDPTHVSMWCMNSFQYYEEGSFARHRLGAAYGITARFRVAQLAEFPCKDVVEEVWKIKAILEAVK